ncbi:Small heat shock protein C2 [Geodia barretti]|nr:Small heat shock protein C2 [Geodia barretti]
MRERRSGSFHRSLRLPDTVDQGKAEPRYEHGVLTITLPKAEAKKAKRFEVKSGGGPRRHPGQLGWQAGPGELRDQCPGATCP